MPNYSWPWAVQLNTSWAAMRPNDCSRNVNLNPHGCWDGFQVNVLVLHEAFSPSTPRLLREAAALLSPQSVSMPVQQAEHVTPITAGGSSGSDQSAKAVFASILHLANTGMCAGSQLLWQSCGCCEIVADVLPYAMQLAVKPDRRPDAHKHLRV